jgi:hypothetical protein
VSKLFRNVPSVIMSPFLLDRNVPLSSILFT